MSLSHGHNKNHALEFIARTLIAEPDRSALFSLLSSELSQFEKCRPGPAADRERRRRRLRAAATREPFETGPV